MMTKYNGRKTLKTLGVQAAQLVLTLHEQGRSVFTLGEVAKITGLQQASARSFIRSLVDRGVATRLRPGLFALVPLELGREREYLGNPYVVARELAGGNHYYLSHASAMDIHSMVTQPQLVVYVTSPHPIRNRIILGMQFRFIVCKPSQFFGISDRWVNKQDKVVVSDLERTVLDGLKQPEYCGGITEVAKGFWIRRADLDSHKVVDYALRLSVGSVMRRLGFIMETYGVSAPSEIERLHKHVTSTYDLLDPLLPREGKFNARWRLRLNVSADELRAVVRT